MPTTLIWSSTHHRWYWPALMVIGLAIVGLTGCTGGSSNDVSFKPAPSPTPVPSPTPTLTPSPTPTPPPLAGLSPVHQPVPMSSDPMLPKYFYLRSGLTPNDTPANVLNVSGNSLNLGSNVVGWVPPNCQNNPDLPAPCSASTFPQAFGQGNELWAFQPVSGSDCTYSSQSCTGYFLSKLGNLTGNTYPGYYLSNSPNLALSVWGVSSPPQIQIFPQQPTNSGEGGKGSFQQWSVAAKNCSYSTGSLACQIQSNLNREDLYLSNVLHPKDPGTTYTAGTQSFSSSNAGAYTWTIYPSYPLDAILAQTPQPLPPFISKIGGGSSPQTVYECFSRNLGLEGLACTLDGNSYTGVRCQYGNLAAPLNSYQDALNTSSLTTCGSAADVTTVANQLNAELTYASAIRNIYQQFAIATNSLFINLGEVAPQLIEDSSLSQSDMVNGTTAAIIEGIIYVGLAASGPFTEGAGSVAAAAFSTLVNILNTAAAAAAAQQKHEFEDEFTVAVADLYTRLSDDFNIVLSTSGQQEETLLADWGMMQAVYPLTLAGGELSWAPESDATLVAQLTPGFAAQFMSILLGSRYSVFQNNYSNTSGFSQTSIPSYDQWAQFVNVSNAGGTTGLCLDSYTGGSNGLVNCNAGSGLVLYHEYWIQATDYSSTYPSQAAINDLINNGVSLHDFFTNNNGFTKFPSQDDTTTCPVAPGKTTKVCVISGSPLKAPFGGENVMIANQFVTGKAEPAGFLHIIQNFTPFTFLVDVNPKKGQTLVDLDHKGNEASLYPYSTVKVALYNNDDSGFTDTVITLTQTNPSTGHTISYEGSGNTCSGTPSFSPDTSSGGGFLFTAPYLYEGLCPFIAGGDVPFQPAMIQVGVYTKDSNQ